MKQAQSSLWAADTGAESLAFGHLLFLPSLLI